MAKRKNMQTTLSQWAYMNRKMGNKASDILKSVGEVEKLLNNVKPKK